LIRAARHEARDDDDYQSLDGPHPRKRKQSHGRSDLSGNERDEEKGHAPQAHTNLTYQTHISVWRGSHTIFQNGRALAAILSRN
jgi:hypothetical protein